MQSVIHDTFGDPALVLKPAERPVPEPGPGEVRIRMILSPIHNHDLWTVRGSYGYKPELPAVGGTEALGIVDAHGEGVSAPAIGQRIVVAGVNGTWSDYFLAPAARLVPLPPEIDDETACQLISMPLSTLMLLEDIDISNGQWMIQNAANGAVGKLVATFARARGIHVVNLVRRDAGIDELAAVGIGNAVSTERPGWEDRVRSVTGGQPIVRGLESVGGAGANQLMSVLADGAALVSFGSMAGKPLEIDSGHLIFRQMTVRGFWGAKRSAMTDRADMARMIGELVKMATVGVLNLSVDAIFDLSDAGVAVGASDRPGRSGKIALRGGAT